MVKRGSAKRSLEWKNRWFIAALVTVKSYGNAPNVFQSDMSTDGRTFSGRRWPHVVASWQEFVVLFLPPVSWCLSSWRCLARMAAIPCSTGIHWRWVASYKNFIRGIFTGPIASVRNTRCIFDWNLRVHVCVCLMCYVTSNNLSIV